MKYYKVSLIVSLVESPYVFGHINISHIPYEKFEEIFIDQLQNDSFLFENGDYILYEDLYMKHKEYLEDQIAFGFDYKIFEYAVGLTYIDSTKYKKNYYEEVPPKLNNKER